MLWTPGNDFNWSVDNFGATLTDTGRGINSPGHANANTKGANTQMLAGIAEDCYGISIGFSGASASATIHRNLVDLLVDPAAGVGGAGSSWSVAIANLLANSPSNGLAITSGVGYWYYFPLYLKAGTAIGTANQSLVAGTLPLRVSIRVYGKPSRPELAWVGTRVQTLGAVTATTQGTAITPTQNAVGTYTASLGTTSFDAWWWQVGIASADTTMAVNSYMVDVAVNATNKILCAEGIPYWACDATERASKMPFGLNLPIRSVASGQDVYARMTCGATVPDSSMTTVVYALGS